MPKDEFDPDDPMELCGVEIPGGDPAGMAVCILEEYVRMGAGDEQLMKFFQDSQYAGTHRVYQLKGEAWVRDLIRDVRTKWGYWK